MFIDCRGQGRTCNMLIRDLCGYFISKHGVNIKYQNHHNLQKILGHLVPVFTFEPNGSQLATEEDVNDCLQGNIRCSLSFLNIYCQTGPVAKFIYENYKSPIVNEPIDEIFIHVRLGDVQHGNRTPDLHYYQKILGDTNKQINITSDSPNHSLIQQLTKQYNVKMYNGSEIDTLFEASKYKTVILSLGTFSWMMGLVASKSKKFYPDPSEYTIWHGPIFEQTDWFCVSRTNDMIHTHLH